MLSILDGCFYALDVTAESVLNLFVCRAVVVTYIYKLAHFMLGPGLPVPSCLPMAADLCPTNASMPSGWLCCLGRRLSLMGKVSFFFVFVFFVPGAPRFLVTAHGGGPLSE